MQEHHRLPRADLYHAPSQALKHACVNGWGQHVTGEDTRLGCIIARIRWHFAHLPVTQ
jgi:hypothetical protein